MLQMIGLLDLKIGNARQTMVKRVPTTLMTNHLRNKEAGHKKARRRDCGIDLPTDNISALIKKEGDLNLHMTQVAEQARAQERQPGDPEQHLHTGDTGRPQMTGHTIRTWNAIHCYNIRQFR